MNGGKFVDFMQPTATFFRRQLYSRLDRLEYDILLCDRISRVECVYRIVVHDCGPLYIIYIMVTCVEWLWLWKVRERLIGFWVVPVSEALCTMESDLYVRPKQRWYCRNNSPVLFHLSRCGFLFSHQNQMAISKRSPEKERVACWVQEQECRCRALKIMTEQSVHSSE